MEVVYGRVVNLTMKRGKKLLASGAALALIISLSIIYYLGQDVDEGSPGPCPELLGSWFVRYLSDPNPYLDVAISTPPGAAPVKSVTADLKSPGKAYTDITLKYNPQDREWQAICGFLPQPLAGGIWWVSRVRITMAQGSWREYQAGDPYSTYSYTSGGTGPVQQSLRKSKVWIGSFYATERGGPLPLYTIHTFAVRGQRDSNPVLQVYRESDQAAWIAVNDDPDVNQDYARITMPLRPGDTYYIRVDDRYHQGGHYGIKISKSAASGMLISAAEDPDQYEPDGEHGQAKRIRLDEAQSHTFSRRDNIWGDEDWLVFAAPPDGP